MDNSNMQRNRQNEYLGVNKIGKNIRKSPLHQPNFVNNTNNGPGSGGNNINNSSARQQPQPQVYNISKNDFRSIVQQLTGSPSHPHQDPLPRPTNNPPKHPSMRLQRIRPPPLTPITRPPIPQVVPAPMQPHPQGPHMVRPTAPFNNNNNNNSINHHQHNNFARPPPAQFGQPSPRGMQPLPHGGDPAWTTPALSPISAYMQQLQNCIGDGGARPGQPQWQQYQVPPGQQVQAQSQMMQPQVSGQNLGQPPGQPQQYPGEVQGQPPSSGLLPNLSRPPLSSPRMNGPALLPSPTSQFLLPSPTGLFNLLSPTARSPYPLLSPGSQFPPPLSPNFAFSPMGQSGILGPGPQPPLSPGILFPQSPSGFFPISSPRWGN